MIVSRGGVVTFVISSASISEFELCGQRYCNVSPNIIRDCPPSSEAKLAL